MKVRRKSLHRRINSKLAKKRANQRAAKARKRLAAIGTLPDLPPLAPPPSSPSGFIITIRCLDDGETASFRSLRLPWGLSVSPTMAGRKVAAVLANYRPLTLSSPK